MGLNDDQRKLIAPGDYLLVTEKEPVYLEDKNMNWRDYRKYLAVLKANNILNKANELGICSPSEALSSYTYEELEKLINENEN